MNRLLRSFLDVIQNRRNRRRLLRQKSASDSGIESLEARKVLTVTFHGGALIANVQAQGIYLGSDWQSTDSLQALTSKFDVYLSTLVSGPYMDMMTNAGYNVGRGTASPGVINSAALNKTSGVTDLAIQRYIQSMITAGQVQAPNTSRLYVVYVEPGVVVKDGTDTRANSFLGYHGAFAGRTKTGAAADIRYAVLPYPGGVNPEPTSQGFNNSFDQLTVVTSHEIAEAVTDPDVNYKTVGWYDDKLDGEIGDLTDLTAVLNGYLVQQLVNKNDKPIAPQVTASPTVSIKALDSKASETRSGENANGGTFVISRTGSTVSSLTVQLIVGGSATNGTDYNAIPGTVTIPAGAASITVSLAVKDDSLVEAQESAVFTLASGPGYSIGAASSATIAIADNDSNNDLFGNRTVLTGTSVVATGSNVGASLENGERNVLGSSGASVWWTWQATSSGRVTLSTAGSSFDTTLGVFQGKTVSTLKQIAVNDDQNYDRGIYTSWLTFTAVAGQFYEIAVSGYADTATAAETGSIRLSLNLTTNAANAVVRQQDETLWRESFHEIDDPTARHEHRRSRRS